MLIYSNIFAKAGRKSALNRHYEVTGVKLMFESYFDGIAVDNY